MGNDINFHDACHNKQDCRQYETCPMKLVHKLISGKWKILILWYLCGGALRFSDLKRKLPNVTQKMLTNQLRSLEDDGLIYRNVYPVFPPKVEYGLTDLGNSITPMLKEMYKFGIMYSNEHDSIKNTDKLIEIDV